VKLLDLAGKSVEQAKGHGLKRISILGLQLKKGQTVEGISRTEA
jgi:hypothetical protein